MKHQSLGLITQASVTKPPSKVPLDSEIWGNYPCGVAWRKHKSEFIEEMSHPISLPFNFKIKEEWMVEYFMNYGQHQKILECFVRWKGFTSSKNTYKPQKNLETCADMTRNCNFRIPKSGLTTSNGQRKKREAIDFYHVLVLLLLGHG